MNEAHNGVSIRNYRRIIMGLYSAAIMIIAGMIMANMFFKDRVKTYYGLHQYKTITSNWKDCSGRRFDFSDLKGYVNSKDQNISAYYRVPDNLLLDQSLVLRSKNTYISVSIDNKVIYQTDITNGPFCNNSPGTRWNVITIPKECSGKIVTLGIKEAYNDHRCKVDNIYFGDRGAILVDIIKNKSVVLFISVLMFIVGIIYFVVSIALNINRKEKNFGLIYLGIFAILCSVWCIIETNILQLFSNNLRALQTIDDILLVIGSMPLLFYIDSLHGIFKYRCIKWFCTLDLIYILESTISQLLGIYDYHQTLIGAHIVYGVISIILIGCIIKQARENKKKKNDISAQVQSVGIIILAASVFFDLVRFLTSDVMDRALNIRIGLLILIIIFGVENIYEMIRLINKGMHAAMISKLAYKDGLTDIGNRTAYKEAMDKLSEEMTSMSVGIVMFDINNLKATNDNIGHQEGDELIKISSQIIADTFGSEGKVYRIGGDEFVSLIVSDNPEEMYSRMRIAFDKAIAIENNEGNHPFEISIAHGVAYCSINSKYDIRLAQKIADKEMYKNKNQIKNLKRKCPL